VPHTTVFEALADSLRMATVYNKDDAVPPAAVLWTDERREFERLLPRIRLEMPNVLTLGAYDPDTRTGPAIWLRCVLRAYASISAVASTLRR